MTAMNHDTRREIVPLLPRFLRSWSRGWEGLRPLIAELGLTRPQFFLLCALATERDSGVSMTKAEMMADLGNPYRTIHPFLPDLPALVAGGWLTQAANDYTVSARGHEAFDRSEAAKRQHLATVVPSGVALADVSVLADRLTEIAARLWDAPEPAMKAHAARDRRATAPPGSTPMVRLLDAVYMLWSARDDAHIAAWRAAGFTGPVFDLLSRVWAGEATDVPALIATVAEGQRPEDVIAGVNTLVADSLLTWEGDLLRLTPRGQTTRDAVEAETDRIYFAPWPPFAEMEVRWLRDTLAAVITGLPATS